MIQKAGGLEVQTAAVFVELRHLLLLQGGGGRQHESVGSRFIELLAAPTVCTNAP